MDGGSTRERASFHQAEAERLAERAARLRIFPDEAGRFDRSLLDLSGEALVISIVASVVGILAGRRARGPGALRFLGGMAVLLAGLWMMATHLPLVAEAMRGEAPWPATIYHTSAALAVFGLGLLWATVTWSEADDTRRPAPAQT